MPHGTWRLYPAARLIRLPENISTQDAATLLFKGLTAQYLIKSTYPVGPGTVILLYDVAGAVGRLLASWAKHLGTIVIGVVSRPESIAAAKRPGATKCWSGAATICPMPSARRAAGAWRTLSMTASVERPSTRRSIVCGLVA